MCVCMYTHICIYIHVCLFMLSLWLSVGHAMSLYVPAAPLWWGVHTTCALPHVFDTVLAGL